MISDIEKLLGGEAETLLRHQCRTISRDMLHLPGPDYLDRTFIDTDRPATVLRNMASMYNHGRLAGTGYLSILPVDQGIEHSAGGFVCSESGVFRS
jgi:class I fructose-bisphosphate aldolase